MAEPPPSTLERFKSAFHLRRALAIAVTTVAMVVSYGAILVGLAEGSAEDGARLGGTVFGVGLVLVPMTFALGAFTTGHPRPWLGVVKALVLWLAATPLLFLDVILSLVTAFAAGMTSAIYHRGSRWQARMGVVAVVAAATLVLLLTLPAAAVFGPLVAIGPAIAYVDDWTDRRQNVSP